MRRFFRNPFKSAVFILSMAACVVAAIQIASLSEKRTPSEQVKEAEKKLSDLHEEISQEVDRINDLQNKTELDDFFREKRHENIGFSFYLLKNDSLIYWSDNEPAVTDSMLISIKDNELLRLSNGDFLACTKVSDRKKSIGLILVKHSYDYENKYLINEFNPALGIGKDLFLSKTGDTLQLPGNKFFYVLGKNSGDNVQEPSAYSWLYLFVSLLIFISIYLLLRYFSGSLLKSALFILFIVGLRTLMIYLKLPEGLYAHEIFSPSNYASSFYFHSLGDMLFNATLLLIFSVNLYESAGKRRRLLVTFIWAISAVAIHLLIRGLVINSKISFELSNPSDINRYSILAFTSVSILLLCFLFITASFFKNRFGYSISGRHAWMGISICALYSAIVFTQMNEIKEHEIRKLIAQKAEMSQDHIAEYLFREQEEKIMKDPEIQGIIHNRTRVTEELTSLLSQKYFNGYLSKFDISVQDYDLNNPTDTNINLDYFIKKSQQGNVTYSKHLFYLNDEAGGASYLAILPLDEKEHSHTLVVTMTARFLQSTRGFPELFMSGRSQENYPSDEYSLARYSGQRLDYEFGNYVYPLTGKDFSKPEEDFIFQETTSYSHLIHRINDHSFIVVTKAKGNLLGILTLFSWMFTFLSMFAFLVFVLSGIIGEGSAWQWNLTRRVQSSVIFLVVLTFILVGTGTVYYINRKYVNDQRKSISDQVNALWFMVRENSFMQPRSDNAGIDQNLELDRLVNNTNIDFNIFDGDGKMIYSSQPKIFDKGIISIRMNPGAYFRITEKGLTQFIHPENVGLLRYIAAYAPFTDRAGNIIAFLNVPYFEKQNDLNKEVSVFLSALVNIYVLLFALAVILTIFISSRITKPLLLIQEKMAGIRLGAINEKIAYKENDEIGKLIHEYNRMIDELSISAEKLAKSERETAWREMARQVAHEIKNPLTPMKLSVQHLHRTFKDKGYGDDELVDRITATLIQQIDTLSNIANAFSNFAKMPQPVEARTDIREVIQQMTALYQEEADITINDTGEDYFVLVDKDRLIGIFSNLLKNAVQAIPPERRGLIGISIGKKDGRITVEIADNGIGIPEDQRDKIFTPNFTTKSSGMGLGLAIVRNIVEDALGSIWFTSTYGKGSSFFVMLPEAN